MLHSTVNMNSNESSADEHSPIVLGAGKENQCDTPEVMKSIDCLQFSLNQHYLIAE